MGTFNENQEASVDFSAVECRKGSGRIRYIRIELLNLAYEPKTVIRSGDNLILRLHYEATEEVQYPSFGLKILSELGTLITETSTWHHGIEIPVVSRGNGYIDLEFDLINLLPAHYYISLWLTGPGNMIFDGMELCARLDIEDGNVYRSSRRIDARYGIVFFPQRWDLSQINADVRLPPVQCLESLGCGS
jgi:hypothetical protein